MAATSRSRLAGGIFYAALGLLMMAILFQFWDDLVRGTIGTKIAENSESYTAALLLAVWVQFVRPRLADSSRMWAATLIAAIACLAVGVVLYQSDDYPSRFRTLNEAFLAIALVIPYVQLTRPLPSRLAWGLSGAGMVVMLVFGGTTLGTNLAETLGILVLVPIGLDVVDRGILDPRALDRTTLRYVWYAVLLVGPYVLHGVHDLSGSDGWFGSAMRYSVRMHESFVFMLLFELYFAVGLGRRGLRGSDAAAEAVETA
jgi:hypothetical protein